MREIRTSDKGTDGKYVVVAGGVNIDIGGRSFGSLKAGDSNPGRIWTGPGGVGRNIAHNLSLLGVRVKLFSAVGEDHYGRLILESCREAGMDLEHVLQVPDLPTSAYLFINNREGEMAVAVSDMEICGALTPGYFEENLDVLNGAAAVVVDTNLPEESIGYLAEHVTVPVFADPVSAAKAKKLLPFLKKLYAVKPNRLEAELLSGIPVTDESSLRQAAAKLVGEGIRRVYITLGKDGVMAADQENMYLLPGYPCIAGNVTGAGDAFMAGLCWGCLQGMDLRQSAELALAAAAINTESRETIAPELSAEAVKRKILGKDRAE